MVSSREDQLLLFVTEKNAGFFFENIFRIDFCQTVKLDHQLLHNSFSFNMPDPALIPSVAIQNNATEGSRGLIEIRPLYLDFPSSEEEYDF